LPSDDLEFWCHVMY
nr:Chain A, Fz7 binding peptide [unidentified]5W96_B Chain B, Fz7 binding peptide [unidentified]